MKRIVCSLFIVSILATLASCSDSSEMINGSTHLDETSGKPIELEKKTPLDSLEKRDFNGKVFTILDANDFQSTYQNLPGDEQNGETLNDGLIDRANYVEENLCIQFDYLHTSSTEGTQNIRNTVLADEHYADLVIGQIMMNINGLATEGLLINLLDIDGFSFDQKWWSSYMCDALTYNEKMYFTTGDISPTMYSVLSAMFINNRLVDDYDINVDFYGLVKEGKWTIDRLIEITKGIDYDIDNNGLYEVDKDTVGFAVMMNDLSAGALLAGSGVRFCDSTKEEIRVDLATDQVNSVIDKIKEFITPLSYDDQKLVLNMFKEGRALSLLHLVASGKNWFRDMDDDFIILPVPKWDEKQDNYVSLANVWSPAYVTVPKTADADIVGYVAEMLARYSYQHIRPQFYDVVLKQKGARDETSGEMLDIIFENAYIDLNVVYSFGDSYMNLRDIMFFDAPFVSTMTSVQSKMNAAIADFEKNW